ncbi:MAG TPA: HipA family kinase [Steroidobacteraceae bacterium]|nr:HipA family kinase [Steroidobacteraceae bacterium]
MNIRTVIATRYVTPLKEGGSLPAIVEADDDGMYVLKFRGSGQGPNALIAELVAGEIARALKLPVPEIVFIELDAELARTEPDPEIQDLIVKSAGLNIALDYLPGAVTFDPITTQPSSELSSAIVWFDALVTNVDRTVRNTNMLMWHGKLRLIDHGAALYFHHSWENYLERSRDPFAVVKDHVLLKFANDLTAADEHLSKILTAKVFSDIVAQIPAQWLSGDVFSSPEEYRHAYLQYLKRRLEAPRTFLEEALRARSMLV